MKLKRSIEWLLAIVLIAGYAFFMSLKRPAEDKNVVLAPVSIESSVPTNSWIKHYDVYVSNIPWRKWNPRYVPLLFLPRDSAFHKRVDRQDFMWFVGAFGSTNMVKPFCPTQGDIDSGRPFIVYLDYDIGPRVTDKDIERVEIRLPEDR
jgi:hypothetical protein